MPAPQHPQPPLEIDATPPGAVVEFGSEPAPRRRSRFDTSGLGRALLADRRTVPLAAGLAALAGLVALLSEWQVTTLEAGAFPEQGERVLPSGIDDLGALGIGFVLGVFLVVPAMVFTLFGPPAGRRHARLAGLSVAGTQLALLFAVATTLSTESYVINPIFRVNLDEGETTIGYGRGIWCAFAAVLLALAAFYLAGRHLPAGAPAVAPTDPAAVDVEPEPVWSWRRPQTREADRPEDEPLDLTVAPSQPFTSLQEDRDRPN